MATDDLFSIPGKREEQLQQRGGMQEEVQDCYGPAHARRSDPDTSHRAAREVTPHTDTIRADVERWARGRGPEGFIDDELSAAFDASDSSSYRTRRAELTDAGRVIFSGRKRMNGNGRQCMVWMHADFRHSTPGFEKPLTMTEKLAAHANRLDASAKWFRSQGWTGHSDELEETAALIRTALEAGQKAKKTTG
jgi:hypothetical protein